MIAPIRYKFWSCDKNNLCIDHYYFVYACISINAYCYEIYYISLEIVWWALSNTSLIVQICLVIHKILVNKAFTVTDGLTSQLFVATFVYLTYMWIALIWGFSVHLSLWKSVYLLWRYKLNEVCNKLIKV